MNIEVKFPDEEIGRFVRTVFEDQVPFATSLALNRTGVLFQKKERDHLREIFEIRRKAFADRSIKIKPFATKAKPEVRISVDSPGDRDDIFAKFEDQTQKSPFRGRSVAVPTRNVPRTPAGVIKKGWRPSQLFEGAQQHDSGRVFKSRGNIFRGKKRTFLIRRPGGRGTIFQRTKVGSIEAIGQKDPTIRVLYQLVPFVNIEPELQFIRNAGTTVNEEWQRQFGLAFDRATRTRRR